MPLCKRSRLLETFNVAEKLLTALLGFVFPIRDKDNGRYVEALSGDDFTTETAPISELTLRIFESVASHYNRILSCFIPGPVHRAAAPAAKCYASGDGNSPNSFGCFDA